MILAGDKRKVYTPQSSRKLNIWFSSWTTFIFIFSFAKIPLNYLNYFEKKPRSCSGSAAGRLMTSFVNLLLTQQIHPLMLEYHHHFLHLTFLDQYTLPLPC